MERLRPALLRLAQAVFIVSLTIAGYSLAGPSIAEATTPSKPPPTYFSSNVFPCTVANSCGNPCPTYTTGIQWLTSGCSLVAGTFTQGSCKCF
jgi:hypothetical protein